MAPSNFTGVCVQIAFSSMSPPTQGHNKNSRYGIDGRCFFEQPPGQKTTPIGGHLRNRFLRQFDGTLRNQLNRGELRVGREE